MTKDANVKRAARARARQTGESYAKVRAELERDDLALTRDILGETPISIEQVLISGRGWAEPYVHRVRTKRHVVYLKHGPASKTGGAYALEAWAYGLCREHGVLVPEVVDAAAPGAEFDYIATIELPGASLWSHQLGPTEVRIVLHQAGEQLRAMHEIQLDGYGPITTPGTGNQSRWCPSIEVAGTENLPYLVDRGGLTAAEADDIQRKLAEAAAHISSDGPSRLLHGDLEGDHLFAHDDRFTGFIDFGAMQAGDPIYDLARFAWWDSHMLADLVDGYGRDRITDDDLHIRMPAYLIARSTAIVGEVRANIRPPQQAGEFVRIASAMRFDRSSGRITATPPPKKEQKSSFEILVDAVHAKSDQEIDAFAASMGGYRRLCGMVFDGLAPTLTPEQDCTVGFVLGDDLGWALRSADGKTTVTKRLPKHTAAIVQARPPDFLRWVTRDLSWASALAEGRIKVEGDQAPVETMFARLVAPRSSGGSGRAS